MAGCAGRIVVMLYSISVKVDTFCLAVLIACYGACVLDWCAGVWAEVVVLMPLHWFVCSCLFSQSGFFLFFFVFGLNFPESF